MLYKYSDASAEASVFLCIETLVYETLIVYWLLLVCYLLLCIYCYIVVDWLSWRILVCTEIRS